MLSTEDGVSWMGVDYWDEAPNGRESVRLQSIETFNEVLIIADFVWVPGSYFIITYIL
jgi:hypothetical protein